MAKRTPKASDLPETIHVRYERMTDREPAYFIALREAEDHAELGETFDVGEYRLIRVVKVTAEAKINP